MMSIFRLCIVKTIGTVDDVAALKGWRNEVFGKDAIALRKGDLAIALDGGEAVVAELED